MAKHKKNQGYSLVELIVVIAIIAVVAGLSLISVTLIHSAKAKNASTTVDSEISTLITKSKNMSSDRAGWQYAARIYSDEKGAYYFQKGYYDPSSKTYDFKDTDTEGEGKGIALSSYVVIKYTGTCPNVAFSNSTMTGTEDINLTVNDHELKNLCTANGNPGGGLFIRFAKDGTCESGVGDIRFYKRNGNIVAHEYIRANGSHQSR